jgi:TPR repeat protein
MKTINDVRHDVRHELRRERGQIDQRVAIGIGILVAAVVVLAVIWLVSREPEPEPIPEPGRPIETVEPAESPAERGDSAREIIDELSSGVSSADPDYAQAYERAREFQADGRSADAMLLYFFAARGGHAVAAFDLATFHDPNHHAETSSLMDEPQPFQAYRWYRQAQEAGHETASERLTELRAWAERAAGTGDTEAERLLLQWE